MAGWAWALLAVAVFGAFMAWYQPMSRTDLSEPRGGGE